MKIARTKNSEYIPVTITFETKTEERLFLEFVDSYNNREALYHNHALDKLLIEISNWFTSEGR